MLNSFIECITKNLKDRGFGKKRIDEIAKQYEARQKFHTGNGKNVVDASTLAMKDVFDNITKEALEKAKRTSATLAVHATHVKNIKEGLTVDTKVFTMKDMSGHQVGPRGGRGHAMAMAAVSMIEKNPNFSAISYDLERETLRQQFYSLLGPTFDKIAIGMLGRQKGKLHVDHLPDEMFKPGSTGDKTAEALAHAWDRVGQVGVDLFNQAGGSMNKLPRYMPQPFNNVAKLLKAGKEFFVKEHMSMVDWDKTRFEDGSPVAPDKRGDFLGNIYETKSSDGVNKIDPASYRGNGRAMGNALDQHRLVHYVDATAWKRAHELFGDGTPFDVMVHHIDDLSHRNAAIRVFGPNPDLAAKNIQQLTKKLAYDAGLKGKDLSDIEAVFKDKFNKMFDVTMHRNPMNPDSLWGATVAGVNNVNTFALLGQAVFASTLGDKATMSVVKKANGMPIFGGMDTMIRSLVTRPEEQRHLQIQSGFIADGVAHAMSSIQRFNPLTSVGPQATRRLADITIRGTGMNAITNAHRWVGQVEQMGFLHTLKDKEFDALPIKNVMKKYGIGAKEWDNFRSTVAPFSPREGANWLRPIDILNTEHADKQSLYTKFQSMILQESYHMVPKATVEASVALRGTERPDTILGTLAYSFSAFRNYPMTYAYLFGRLGLRQESIKGRMGFYAGLAAATTVAGVIASQLGEVGKGRDLIDWSDPRLWGKGFMKGGGAGIFSDFLFADTGEYGQSLAETMAGPNIGLAGDLTALAFGDAFSVVNELMKKGDLQNYDSKTGKRAVALARKYGPGSNFFYSSTLLQRTFWDRVEDIVDPKAQNERAARMRKWESDHGNKYYWPLGSSSPERAPDFKME